jgi:hypothetical protein
MGDTVTDAVDTVNGSCDRLGIPSIGPPKPGFRLADEGAGGFIAEGHEDGPAGAQCGDGRSVGIGSVLEPGRSVLAYEPSPPVDNRVGAIEVNDQLNVLVQQRLLSVGTVDSFQGQERDIIAISLTRSNRSGDIGFLSDIRRMNVGMTRARRKLLVVGDSSTLSVHPFFKELLAFVVRIGGYRTAWEIVDQG